MCLRDVGERDLRGMNPCHASHGLRRSHVEGVSENGCTSDPWGPAHFWEAVSGEGFDEVCESENESGSGIESEEEVDQRARQ